MSFRPSVRPSVKCVNCDQTKESCDHILISHERTFIPVFWQEEWLVVRDRLYLKFWVKHSNWPCWSENADFQSIFARSASAV